MSKRKGQEQAVRSALDDLLRSAELERSPQLAKFLRYVVEAKLAGDEQNIKAYSIAVDVFGRSASFDPQADPIVRVQARRLRAALDRYYASGEARGPIRIRLPIGRYTPDFEPFTVPELPPEIVPPPIDAADTGPTAQPGLDAAYSPPEVALDEPLPFGPPAFAVESAASPRTREGPVPLRVGLVLAVVVVLFGALALDRGWLGSSAPPMLPGAPEVFVGDFTNVSGLAELDDMAPRLRESVTTDLSGFADLVVADAHSRLSIPASALLLSGSIRRTREGIEIGAVVSAGGDRAAVWNTLVEEPLPSSNSWPVIIETARLVAGRAATFRGPLQANGRAWLKQQNGLEQTPNLYTCMLRYRQVGEEEQGVTGSTAIECFDRLLAVNPNDPIALAGRGWLDALQAVRTPSDATPHALVAPDLKALAQAVALAPGSAFVHALNARMLETDGQRDAARAEFIVALGLNPADLDIRAAYAETLALGGDWQQAMTESRSALTAAPFPPPWYYGVPMLDAFRRGDWDAAIENAIAYTTANREAGAAVAVAAAVRAGRRDVVAQYLDTVLASPLFRRQGILTRLATRVTDPALVAAIGDGLSLAGVPQADMRAPF